MYWKPTLYMYGRGGQPAARKQFLCCPSGPQMKEIIGFYVYLICLSCRCGPQQISQIFFGPHWQKRCPPLMYGFTIQFCFGLVFCVKIHISWLFNCAENFTSNNPRDIIMNNTVFHLNLK